MQQDVTKGVAAGLLLYGLQNASSNLANGADFEPASDDTVAAAYDDFEDDFELGDDAPQLQAEHEEDNEASEHAAKVAEIQEMADAYAKLDAAREQDQLDRRQRGEEIEQEPGFTCNNLVQYLCHMVGPRAVPGLSTEEEQRHERDAASQHLEVRSTFARGNMRQGRGARRRKKRPSRR